MKTKRNLSMLELLGLVLVAIIIAVVFFNVRSCTYEKKTSDGNTTTERSIETTTTPDADS